MRIVWVLLALVVIAIGYSATLRLEQDAPTIEGRTTSAFVGDEYVHEFRVSDAGMGVERVRVWVEQDSLETELLAEAYDGSLLWGADLTVPRRVSVKVLPKELGLADGKAVLKLQARDFSWAGNVSEQAVPLVIDTRPPRLNLETGLTYVRRGGSEMVIYGLDDESADHWVSLGDLRFPGVQLADQPERFVALYALPADSKNPVLEVSARDQAGNSTKITVPISVIERRFPSDTIELSKNFLERKVAELEGGDNADPLAAYLKINNEMRKANDAKLREITSRPSGERLWSGAFLQLPNSRVGASFAEQRDYRYEGKIVDHQVHQGYDLASTAHAPVPAANDAVVAFAGDLGIYGKTVVLDHGLGLFTLYGHLSQIEVEKGSAVGRGDRLGLTGTTGLAGGDHLHYAVLVHGVFVDPLEWFDGKWIAEHIDGELEPEPAQDSIRR